MKVLIVPDVHGRVFWRDILPFVESDEYKKIIFLGDYLDPYSDEGITEESAITQFLDIIELKDKYPNKIILLLGNHDLGYLDMNICECRMMYDDYDAIHNILYSDRESFNITYKIDKYLFSHAGFTRTFLNILKDTFMDDDVNACIDTLNDWFHHGGKHYKTILHLMGYVGRERWGSHPTGSCVWADTNETLVGNPLENNIQIFGHTKLDYIPMYTSSDEKMICIDSKQVFTLDTKTDELKPLNGDNK